MKTRSQAKRRLPLWLSLLANLTAAVLVLAAVQAFVVKMYQVPSGSMEQTLEVGDRILVDRWNASSYVPKNDDVVVFNADSDWYGQSEAPEESLAKRVVKNFGDATGIGPSHARPLVKRIIGSPGDVVECCTSTSGGLTRNGEPVDEPWVFQDLPFVAGQLDCQSAERSRRCFPLVEVPEGKYLMMGDHRSNSSDGISHCRGNTEAENCVRFVDAEHIVGPVSSIVWPLGRITGL